MKKLKVNQHGDQKSSDFMLFLLAVGVIMSAGFFVWNKNVMTSQGRVQGAHTEVVDPVEDLARQLDQIGKNISDR